MDLTMAMIPTYAIGSVTPLGGIKHRSQFSLSVAKTIDDISNELLREIFIISLDEHFTMDKPQPILLDGPINLCHVCYTWREIALNTALLWTHVHFLLHMEWDDKGLAFFTRFPEKLERDFEFLQWWRKNSCGAPPFLNFIMQCLSPYNWEVPPPEIKVGADDLVFLSDYVASAQYLCINRMLMHLMTNAPKESPMVFRNLHTLKTEYFELPDEASPQESFPLGIFYCQFISPVLAPQAVRHLQIRYGGLTQSDPDIFTNWSILTHLHLNELVDIYLNTWFPFLGCLTNLQCAYFSIGGKITMDHDDEVPMTILPNLTTLLVSIASNDDDNEDDDDDNDSISNPISELLENVHMPVLQDLSLHLNSGWDRDQIATDLYPILGRASNVRRLFLGHYVVDPLKNSDDTMITDIEPISKYGPKLRSISLSWEPPFPDIENKPDTLPGQFMEQVCFSEGWLNLSNPRKPLKRILLDIHTYRARHVEDPNLGDVRKRQWARWMIPAFVKSLVAAVQRHPNEVSNVRFLISTDGGLGEHVMEKFAPNPSDAVFSE